MVLGNIDIPINHQGTNIKNSNKFDNFSHNALQGSVFNTAPYIMQALHCPLNTAHHTPNPKHCTIQTAHCTLHNAHFTLHNTHCTPHTAHCTVGKRAAPPHNLTPRPGTPNCLARNLQHGTCNLLPAISNLQHETCYLLPTMDNLKYGT